MSAHPSTVILSHRDAEGDVHVGSMAGAVRPVPGSGTPEGKEAIAVLMRQVLDRVRRHVRQPYRRGT